MKKATSGSRRTGANGQQFVRFGVVPRTEHALALVLFVLLVVSGLPQRWPHVALSRVTIDVFGGIFALRALHRVAGVAFGVLAAVHVVRVALLVGSRRVGPTMFLARQDFSDAVHYARYCLGREDSPPRFARYDYRQKFEYWGLLFGSAVMVGTGLVLMYPLLVVRLLPSELIPVSKVVHSNEALLALAIVVVWHLGNAFLEGGPGLDTTIFTGRISRERMEHEHPLELEERYLSDAGGEAAAAAEERPGLEETGTGEEAPVGEATRPGGDGASVSGG